MARNVLEVDEGNHRGDGIGTLSTVSAPVRRPTGPTDFALDLADREAFERDGAVCIRGAMGDWLDLIVEGIDENLERPGPYAAENDVAPGDGRFFDDYCNWQRIPPFERVAKESPAADIAQFLMGGSAVQFFHDHVLVKEPGTSKPTPWHSDNPYYFVEATKTVSLWIPVDPVTSATSLRVIAGSHRWEADVFPVSWADDSAFYDGTTVDGETYRPVPDPANDPDEHDVLEWDLEPGDLVAFDFRAAHGARGNERSTRRRVLSLRFVGDDARFVERPGRTSPPFPGHGMAPGDRLRADWFPHVRS